jgi:hypothetical protein
MHRFSPIDTELIGTVNAHLEQLAGVAFCQVGEARLRVVSTSLRYLLVEDMLSRAWRAARFGGPMTFKTWCIASTQGESTVAFCGGGQMLPGIPFSLCWNAELAERTLDLTAFRNCPRVQVGSVKVSTIELIQYVANTLGGAHFDPEGKSPKSRKPAFDLLRRVQADGVHSLTFKVNNRGLLDHEILSVTETILRSSEVQRLMEWRTSAQMSAS